MAELNNGVNVAELDLGELEVGLEGLHAAISSGLNAGEVGNFLHKPMTNGKSESSRWNRRETER